MYWQDDTTQDEGDRVPREVVDMSFLTRCARLPVDHAWALCTSVQRVLPWLHEDRRCGIHLIHVAESGNGWQRPEGEDCLILSRRTRLSLRVPMERRQDARALCGETIGVDGFAMQIGDATEKPLVPSPTVFSRHVETDAQADETHLLDDVARRLEELGITPRRMLCGKLHTFETPEAPVYARSILIADLDRDESIVLQQSGIGERSMLGMGLFLPHKGIEAAFNKTDER